ncbi:hypothetical protein SAMN05428946_2705 [Edaphobacillus lindanitolerans]|uniref:Uncharacterized protein n=1 Tax=Edaphobacillus lindanitolerans TaxID=550447 RepID=A0A1U7PMZ5_9BACI|nr:hypothetical protein SAMN05428946_2705 [Edaphobacillus lindanitolerans]
MNRFIAQERAGACLSVSVDEHEHESAKAAKRL